MNLYPITDILYRVFKIQVVAITGSGEEFLSGGTAFAIDTGNREYIVTARHIARHIARNTRVQVWRTGKWDSIPVNIVGHGRGDVDISVLASTAGMIPNDARYPLPTGAGGLLLGQEMMFLGFPHGYDVTTTHLLRTGYPVPAVKYARLSVLPRRNFPMWLDGHNNEGFSGAPLCFKERGKDNLRIAGVVSAYRRIKKPVYDALDRQTGMYHKENMGFGLAWSIQHCMDIISENPIGLELPEPIIE